MWRGPDEKEDTRDIRKRTSRPRALRGSSRKREYPPAEAASRGENSRKPRISRPWLRMPGVCPGPNPRVRERNRPCESSRVSSKTVRAISSSAQTIEIDSTRAPKPNDTVLTEKLRSGIPWVNWRLVRTYAGYATAATRRIRAPKRQCLLSGRSLAQGGAVPANAALAVSNKINTDTFVMHVLLSVAERVCM